MVIIVKYDSHMRDNVNEYAEPVTCTQRLQEEKKRRHKKLTTYQILCKRTAIHKTRPRGYSSYAHLMLHRLPNRRTF